VPAVKHANERQYSFVPSTLQPVIERRSPTPGLWWRWTVVLVPGVLLYFFALPGMNTAQERLFAIFAASIIALVAQPVRMGVSVLLAMTLLALTGTLTPARVLAGFGNVTVWMVFTAFLFSRAVTQTGFGTRVGYRFIERFGRTPLRLGYSLAAADLVLAPFIPSDTARGGGIKQLPKPAGQLPVIQFTGRQRELHGTLGRRLEVVVIGGTVIIDSFFVENIGAFGRAPSLAVPISKISDQSSQSLRRPRSAFATKNNKRLLCMHEALGRFL